MTKRAAEKFVETQTLCAKGHGRYSYEYATEAASVTARMDNSHEELPDLRVAVTDPICCEPTNGSCAIKAHRANGRRVENLPEIPLAQAQGNHS